MNLKNCPSCKGKGTMRIILWGMPAEEPDPDKYVIGGCCLSPTGVDPTHECIKCGWQRFPDSQVTLSRIWASLDHKNPL